VSEEMNQMEIREETKRRPLYQRTAETLSEILESVEPGTYLPSEPKLARSLGVSRATLREAMRIFERRGMIVRRQGVGTYVTQLPHVIDTGIETLESIERLADRIGLKVETGDLEIRKRTATEVRTSNRVNSGVRSSMPCFNKMNLSCGNVQQISPQYRPPRRSPVI